MGGMEAGRLRRSCRLHPPPSVFWFLFHVEKEPAPQGGTLARRRAEVAAQASFSCPFGAIHLLAPYGQKAKEPGGGGKPQPYRTIAYDKFIPSP